MEAEFLVHKIEGVVILESFCETCEQPLIVPNDIVVKITIDNCRNFLLAKTIPCRHCGRKAVLPKTFDSTKEAVSEIEETCKKICRTNSLSEIKMLSLIEPMDIQEIFS